MSEEQKQVTLPFVPPKYVVMIAKGTTIITAPGEKDQPPIVGGVVHDKEAITQMRKQYPLGQMFCFPVMVNMPLTTLEEVDNFEKEMISKSFDVSNMLRVVDACVKTTFESFKELSTKEKVVLAVKAVFQMIHESPVDVEDLYLDYNVLYKEDGSLDQMIPRNLYSLLMMYAVPVKYSDVKDVKEYHMPYGIFTFMNDEPAFVPYGG